MVQKICEVVADYETRLQEIRLEKFQDTFFLLPRTTTLVASQFQSNVAFFTSLHIHVFYDQRSNVIC